MTFRHLSLAAFLALLAPAALGQGVTTAAINGVVTDVQGEALPGANVIAVHEPSGTEYGTITRPDGRYNLRNMRVGGPYTITVSFVGYEGRSETGVQLALEQDYRADFRLREETVTLGEVAVVADADAVLSAGNVGAGTNVEAEQIERLPTITRSLVDFTRLTPQFSQVGSGGRAGSSVGGASSRYNNIQVDGATINDAFGLESSGTPGGSSGTQPISLDAVQEFRVAISPYDVTQGNFTGGNINVITRSGTNAFEGSAYYLGRNESFVGDRIVGDDRLSFDNFNEFTAGARLGGPILRNRLFFFASGEHVRQTNPVIVGTLDRPAGVTLGAPRSDLEEIQQIAREQYGRDTGSIDQVDTDIVSTKLFGRLDYNVNRNNKLTFRLNYVRAALDDGIYRDNRGFNLQDRYFTRDNTNTSSVLQLNSVLGANAANEFRLSLQTNRQPSTLQFAPFPSIDIQNVGRTDDRTGVRVSLGPDQFRGANNIDANVWELVNNFNYFLGNHVVTLGTQNTYQDFSNLFIRDFYGYYRFDSIEDFRAGRASQFSRNYSAVPGEDRPVAAFAQAIFGVYAQDEWTVNPQLKLTAGLRLDLPHYFDRPAFAGQNFVDAFGFDNSEVPNGNPVISPRFGFNYALTEARDTQFRGGLGVFSGRNPAVWISNSFSNDGSLLGSVFVSPRADRPVTVGGQQLTYVPFRQDPANQYTAEDFGLPQGSAEINLTDPDFRSPRIWRTNLAVDQRLPYGLVATGEFIYSGVLSGMQWKELNRTPFVLNPNTVDGRGQSRSAVTQDFQSVILLTNTDQGYSYTATAQVEKRLNRGVFPNAFGSLSYTFGETRDINSVTSSQARSNPRDLPIGYDVNNPPLTTSDFDIRHRLLGNASYRIPYAGRFATTLTMVYVGHSGSPYSYVYQRGADPNSDRFDRANLVYVPRDRSEVEMSDADWTAFNALIEANPALRSQRGQIFERNSARLPWQNVLDARLTQEIQTLRGQRVEITLDVLNVLNLLNSDWGQVEFVDESRFVLVNFDGYAPDGRARLSRPNTGEVGTPSDLASRWQMQLGLRYTF
jgi:outer membrane receptor protein involved in Fe transport